MVGSNSLTTFIATIISIDGGMVLAGAVTVTVLSDVWVRVRARVSRTGTAGGVAAEPPSTATTEYATPLRTAGA